MGLRLLYATDLCGCPWKYAQLAKQARAYRVDVVIHGGGLLPAGGDLFTQGRFLESGLRDHFQCLGAADIRVLCCLGIDDLRIWDGDFEQLCAEFPHVTNLAQRCVRLGNYAFIGTHWAADTPFGLKDRCLRDTEDAGVPEQFGPPVLSTRQGWWEIPDWPAHARHRPTLAQTLDTLPDPEASLRPIYLIPTPPRRLGLDLGGEGPVLGSEAVYDFLDRGQPHLALHAPVGPLRDPGGSWYATLGRTLCVQPGQGREFAFVLVDLDSLDLARLTVPEPSA